MWELKAKDTNPKALVEACVSRARKSALDFSIKVKQQWPVFCCPPCRSYLLSFLICFPRTSAARLTAFGRWAARALLVITVIFLCNSSEQPSENAKTTCRKDWGCWQTVAASQLSGRQQGCTSRVQLQLKPTCWQEFCNICMCSSESTSCEILKLSYIRGHFKDLIENTYFIYIIYIIHIIYK